MLVGLCLTLQDLNQNWNAKNIGEPVWSDSVLGFMYSNNILFSFKTYDMSWRKVLGCYLLKWYKYKSKSVSWTHLEDMVVCILSKNYEMGPIHFEWNGEMDHEFT